MGAPRKQQISDEVCDNGDNGATDLVFGLVGDPIPVLPAASPPRLAIFDDPLPVRPIVVSDRYTRIFIAHPEGFVVTEPKALIAAAKEKRENCVQDFCTVDVPLPGVSILSISHDDSVLAACTDSQILLFSLSALITKDVKPLSQFSLGKAGRLKDLKWLNDLPGAFIVLSEDGFLSHCKVGQELKGICENAEAAAPSKEGHIAVVKNKKVGIMSPNFKEMLRIPLSLDGNDCKRIKVDCIGWVRSDCIVIGCIGLNEGNEEYMVEVIRSDTSTFFEGPGKAVVYTYRDLFNGIIDDPRVGRTLRFGYLHHWGLMLASNTTSFHGQIDALRWIPTIDVKASTFLMLEHNYIGNVDVQEDDKKNAILGFGVGNLSLLENTSLTVGLGQMEVVPEHILLYLTGDGKLAIYCLARTSDIFFTAETVMRKDLSPIVTSLVCQIIPTEHILDATSTQTVNLKPKLSFKLPTNASKKQLVPPSGLISVKEESVDLQFHCDDSDKKPVKLCFDEVETLLHDLLVCQADKSHCIDLSAYLDGFGKLVFMELTPGALDHECLYTRVEFKDLLRELYILFKCLHQRGYSLAGKFGLHNFVVYEARMRVTIKLANVTERMLLKDSCDGPHLDLEGLVRLVRRDIQKQVHST